MRGEEDELQLGDCTAEAAGEGLDMGLKFCCI